MTKDAPASAQLVGLQSALALSSGKSIPFVGLGVCASSRCEQSAFAALQAGYRHLDTAQIYFNERETGSAVKTFLSQNPSVQRSDIFLCSKLWEVDLSKSGPYSSIEAGHTTFTRNGAIEGLEKSLNTMGLEYLDLYLLHNPRPGPKARLEAWLGLQDCLKAGKVGSIGVSNWAPRHIEEVMSHAEVNVLPAANQIEFHPWNQQREIVNYCRERGIVVIAYSPLTQGNRLGDNVIVKIAQKHGKTPAQVVLRWCLQMGVVVIPKSDKEERIRENSKLFGWEIDAEDMNEIAELDEGQRGNVGEWDPFAWE
jgi:diketogulonate reductase-like aldo/keto reductase